MTPSQLKAHVEARGSHYFTRQNMRFAGDTMRNYGVRAATINGAQVWELYRKRAVKRGMKHSAYFDAQTFERVFPH